MNVIVGTIAGLAIIGAAIGLIVRASRFKNSRRETAKAFAQRVKSWQTLPWTGLGQLDSPLTKEVVRFRVTTDTGGYWRVTLLDNNKLLNVALGQLAAIGFFTYRDDEDNRYFLFSKNG